MARWGETPCAFIELKAGATVSAKTSWRTAKKHLAAFKVPLRGVWRTAQKTIYGQDPEVRTAQAGSAGDGDVRADEPAIEIVAVHVTEVCSRFFH
jgi:fatty-acyl-CoA synthase